MLFNSYEFLYFFLPVTLAGFFALSGARRAKGAAAWLALASIFFYGYWSPRYVLLLIASIAVNLFAGRAILRFHLAARQREAKSVLISALVANLGALAYFKYAGFFVDNSTALALTPSAYRRDRSADRHFVLHFHADRLPGRHVPGQGPASRARSTTRCSSPTSRT